MGLAKTVLSFTVLYCLALTFMELITSTNIDLHTIMVIFRYMIAVKSLNKSYGDLLVLKNINLEIEPGKITVKVGASGAGKSTYFNY